MSERTQNVVGTSEKFTLKMSGRNIILRRYKDKIKGQKLRKEKEKNLVNHRPQRANALWLFLFIYIVPFFVFPFFPPLSQLHRAREAAHVCTAFPRRTARSAGRV